MALVAWSEFMSTDKEDLELDEDFVAEEADDAEPVV